MTNSARRNSNTNNDAMITIECWVSGKVQGVWFRAFIRDQALRHNVTGWAKNLADGRVQTLLSGKAEALEVIVTALWQGPPLAKVSDVISCPTNYQHYDGFDIF